MTPHQTPPSAPTNPRREAMGEALTVHQVREMLFRACETAGSQKAWAEHYGISGAYVSDVLKGRRDPGDGILVALGLRKIVTYERIPAPGPLANRLTASKKDGKNE